MDVIFPDYHVQIREEDLIATVRDWHPKCATCGHFGRALVGSFGYCRQWEIDEWPDVEEDDYCNHHTGLDKDNPSPDGG
jgi:hypothetical protein